MKNLLRAGPPESKPHSSSPDPTLTELGLAISGLRQERGWSQERLAKEAGVTPETVRQIEHGVTEPREATLEKISRALGSNNS